MAAPKRVFLSSTKAGLGAERTVAWLTLRLRGLDVVRMEDFQSADHDPWQECVAQMDTCHAYVLLIGHEYGSALSDTGLSYTEAEYMRAQRHRLPTFAFVKGGFDEASLRDREALQLRDFQDTVNAAHLIRRPFFRDTDELHCSLDAAITGWQAPTTARPHFSAPRTRTKDEWAYAAASVRRRQLRAHPFKVVIVATQSALAEQLDTDNPSPLMQKAVELRDELRTADVNASILNEIRQYGEDPADILLKRATKVSGSDVIVCFVYGRHDYLKVSAFAEAHGAIAVLVPEWLKLESGRARGDHLTYKASDVAPCRVASMALDYVNMALEDQLVEQVAHVGV